MACWGVLATIAAACQLGMVVSQTTLSPAVASTTASSEIVTDLTATPTGLSTTPPGCLAVNTSTCQLCVPGSYYDNVTLMCSCCPDPGFCLFPGACLLCARGFFQPLPGQQQCLPCGQGFYSNVTGGSMCPSCPLGSASNTTGADTCRSCTPGFFSSQPASKTCSPCPQGTYCNSSNCAQCPVCPVGKESLQLASKDCTQCRPGMHKAAHQTLCQICSSGFFQIHWGQENCDICPESHYCPSPDVSPILCPSDAFCLAGSTSPGYCMEMFFRKSGDFCELAPVTIALLVIGSGVALLFVILMVLRRRRDTDRELSAARAPLLRKERPQGRYYGIPCDAEPVYAGW
ncbi:hypothetical protein NHX12_019943 [Muraenolepis orangiensis]|uniref:TNFR-Cys domain-containing protein n=1 Tax=Muraenolepis orangiensis TaxID=630683 RepID=A0A9Q0EZB9_9TELE|nr:hypothetical protein NHX12_019943 [Muraenolepis orangiensis]